MCIEIDKDPDHGLVASAQMGRLETLGCVGCIGIKRGFDP